MSRKKIFFLIMVLFGIKYHVGLAISLMHLFDSTHWYVVLGPFYALISSIVWTIAVISFLAGLGIWWRIYIKGLLGAINDLRSC